MYNIHRISFVVVDFALAVITSRTRPATLSPRLKPLENIKCFSIFFSDQSLLPLPTIFSFIDEKNQTKNLCFSKSFLQRSVERSWTPLYTSKEQPFGSARIKEGAMVVLKSLSV